MCRVLDGYAFVPIRNFHVMDPDVAPTHVDAVQTPFAAPTDDGIVHLPVDAVLQDEVTLRRWDALEGEALCEKLVLTINQSNVVK